jgi:hypothetical protein
MPSPKKDNAREGALADVQVPTMGRIVHYTSAELNVMPAIVTKVEAVEAPPEPTQLPAERIGKAEGRREGTTTSMHLQGWDSVLGCGHYFVADVAAAARAESGEAETWNWPPTGANGGAHPEPVGR